MDNCEINDQSALVEELVAKCLEMGIREYVVCSGARNLPLVAALSACEVSLWSHFEERSAGFFALGRMMDTREPCAVVVTSGTAVAELLPAVIESHYQGRPLLVISADRPASYRGSGAPQAIEQVGLFGAYVERCVDVASAVDVGGLFDGWGGSQPWHLNVQLAEVVELGGAAMPRVPSEGFALSGKKENFSVGEVVQFIEDSWRGLVVCLGGLEPEDREVVWKLLKRLKVPVVADPTSGLRELLDDLVLSDERVLTKQPPGKVLRIGDVPVGRFWRDLENLAQVDVCSLTRTGLSGLARESLVVRGDLNRLISGMGEMQAVGDVNDLLKGNKRIKSQLDELLERYPDSEPGMLRRLSLYATMSDSLYLGNSLPIREWSNFAQRESPFEIVRANRGANGIDGQVSTWAGWTFGVEGAWAVLGDLTALYDLSAPSLLTECGAAGRVLVVMNNGGGRIFERLPRVRAMELVTRDLISNEHAWSFEPWAVMWGWDYLRADSADDIEIEPQEHPLLVEIVPDDAQTQAFWEMYDQLG